MLYIVYTVLYCAEYTMYILYCPILFSAVQAMARLRESYSAEASPAGYIRPPVVSPGPLEPTAVADVSESSQSEAVVRIPATIISFPVYLPATIISPPVPINAHVTSLDYVINCIYRA